MKSSKFSWFIGGVLTVLVLLIAGMGVAIYWLISGDNTEEASPAATSPSTSASVSVSPSAEPSETVAVPTTIADGRCLKPQDVDAADVDAVAVGYAEIAYCWDPYFDTNMTAAALRSESLMSGALFDKTWAARDVRSGQQNQFAEAGKTNAYSVSSASLVGSQFSGEVDGSTVARTVQVKWYWEGRDGKTVMPGGSAVLQVKLVSNVGRWYVDDVEVISVNAL